MNTQQHVSDEVLLHMLRDEHLETEFAEAETHLDSCAHCRSRLESFAAEDGWIEPYRSCLSDQFAKPLSSGSAHTPQKPRPAVDFEREAISSMLTEILEPSFHSDNLGRLGGYEVEEVLGYGGMGVVVRAYDRELQRPIAIKLIVPRLTQDGTAKQRFSREARAAATVLHPNVIAIHSIGETGSVPWFVMPLITGPTLNELVDQDGPLPEADIVRVGQQLASGLAAAHSHGVIHRDIKPANVLVDNRVNRVVITDFGLARHAADTMITKSGVLAGTVHYMSPEQTRGEDLDGRSDLFSLGSLLYFIATGSTPFASDTPVGVLHKIGSASQIDVRRHNPTISETLATAIDTLLSKDRDQRFQSAAEVEEFFAELISHQNHPTLHQPPSLPRVQPKRNRWLALAIPLTALALFLLGKALPVSEPQMSPEAVWSSIQLEHGLESPSEYHQQVQQLGTAIARLDEDLSSAVEAKDSTLSDRLGSISKRLDAVSKGLNEPER